LSFIKDGLVTRNYRKVSGEWVRDNSA